MQRKQNSGFSLIELMVAVAIIGVLAGIAIPSYNSYISSSAGGTAMNNAQVLMVSQEVYKGEFDSYLAGTHTAGDAGTAFMKALHWDPNDKGLYTYVVSAGTTGDIKTSVKITTTCDNCLTPVVIGN